MVAWWDIYFIGSIVLSQLSEVVLHRCARLVEKEIKSPYLPNIFTTINLEEVDTEEILK